MIYNVYNVYNVHNVYCYTRIVYYISSYTQIVPDLSGWLPSNPDNGAAYHDTFLGRLLSCSTIRRDMILSDITRYVSPYFNRSTVINQDVTQVCRW